MEIAIASQFKDAAESFAKDTLADLRDAITVAIRAIDESAELRKDRDRWKAQYDELLNQSIKNGEHEPWAD
jgi:hypothetical protein